MVQYGMGAAASSEGQRSWIAPALLLLLPLSRFPDMQRVVYTVRISALHCFCFACNAGG